jgi:plastocyanin
MASKSTTNPARVVVFAGIACLAVGTLALGAWTLVGPAASPTAMTAAPSLDALPLEAATALPVADPATAGAAALRASAPRKLATVPSADAREQSTEPQGGSITDQLKAGTAAPQAPGAIASAPKPKPAAVQVVSIAIGASGYEPAAVSVRSGAPIRMTVGQGQGCAAGFLMPQLSISQDNSGGPISFDIGPLRPGTYTFTCGMGMITGRLVVN